MRDPSGIRTSSRMLEQQRTLRSRFTLWGSNLEQDTSETLPTVLWVVLGIYVLWFGLFLMFALENSGLRTDMPEFLLDLFRALVWGVVPVVGAYVIGSDRSWGQWYVPLSFAFLVIAVMARNDFASITTDWKLVGAVILWLVVSILMLVSPACRQFYAGVRHNESALRGPPHGT